MRVLFQLALAAFVLCVDVGYKAVVFQVTSVGRSNCTPAVNIEANLDYLRSQLDFVMTSEVIPPAVAVFPEWVIFRDFLRHPGDHRANAFAYSEVLPPVGADILSYQAAGFQARFLARMALDNKILVAANVLARVPCSRYDAPPCPRDGVYIYNTALLVAPNGTVAAVYYKMHPFKEAPTFDAPTGDYTNAAVADVFLPRAFAISIAPPRGADHRHDAVDNHARSKPITGNRTSNTNPSASTENAASYALDILRRPLASAVVPTSANAVTGAVVRFATFVCFDIDFAAPSQTVHTTRGARDILYPTAWSNVYPIQTAASVQQSYSSAAQVNLAASNALATRGSGSGLFAAGMVVAQTPLTAASAAVGVLFTRSRLGARGADGGTPTTPHEERVVAALRAAAATHSVVMPLTVPPDAVVPQSYDMPSLREIAPSAMPQSGGRLYPVPLEARRGQAVLGAIAASAATAPAPALSPRVQLCLTAYAGVPCVRVPAGVATSVTMAVPSGFVPAGRTVSCAFSGTATIMNGPYADADPSHAAYGDAELFLGLVSSAWTFDTFNPTTTTASPAFPSSSFSTSTDPLAQESCQIMPCRVRAGASGRLRGASDDNGGDQNVTCLNTIDHPLMRIAAGSELVMDGAAPGGEARLYTASSGWLATDSRDQIVSHTVTAGATFASAASRVGGNATASVGESADREGDGDGIVGGNSSTIGRAQSQRVRRVATAPASVSDATFAQHAAQLVNSSRHTITVLRTVNLALLATVNAYLEVL